MTIAQYVKAALDRRGTRSLLAWCATRHARRKTGTKLRVVFDRVWGHELDGRFWSDSERFIYNRHVADKWLRQARVADQQSAEYWYFVYRPKRGDIIVDIGAGDGADLPLFSKAVGPMGQVIAIEAHPVTFSLMEQTVARNGLTNVICLQKAIVDKPCKLEISNFDDHIANSVDLGTSDVAGYEVDGLSLENICQELGISRIDFLKMNIEGAEKLAIHGMASVMPYIRYLCIACHDFRADRGDGEQYRTKAIVTAFLRHHGCQRITRDSHSDPSVRDHVHACGPAELNHASRPDSGLEKFISLGEE